MGLEVSQRMYSWARHIQRHPWRATAVGVLADLALTVATYFHYVESATLAGAAALISVLVAVLAGPLPGVIVALTSGVSLALLVVDPDHPLDALAAAITLVLWVAVAYVAGAVARSLRRQVAERERELSDALGRAVEAGQQADELRVLLDHILSIAPSLHDAHTYQDVALAACRAGRQAFGATGTALYEVEASRLRLVAWDGAASPAPLVDLEGDPQFLERLHSTPLSSLEDFALFPPSVQSLLQDLDMASAVGLSLPTADDVDLLLALWWREPRTPADVGGQVAFLRFADQVALAVTRIRADTVHARLEASLLPSLPVTHPFLQIGFRYRLAERRLGLGGDFFDLLVRDDGCLDLLLGDVSGHGPNAAALGATIRSGWRALRTAGVPLVDTARALNGVLIAERGTAGVYATTIAASLDQEGRRLRWINCGHPPPLLVGEKVERVEGAPCAPLGFLNSQLPKEETRLLPERWALLLYTDGVIEGRAAPGSAERYGEERLIDQLDRGLPRLPDVRVLDRLFQETEVANGGARQDDALALLVSLPGPVSRGAAAVTAPATSTVPARPDGPTGAAKAPKPPAPPSQPIRVMEAGAYPPEPEPLRRDPTNRLLDAYRAMGYQIGRAEEIEGCQWLRLVRSGPGPGTGPEEVWLRLTPEDATLSAEGTALSEDAATSSPEKGPATPETGPPPRQNAAKG